MEEGAPYSPRLPDHPELREIALVIEKAGMIGEVLDAKFRCVFISSETVRSIGMSADEAHSLLGLSTVARSSDQRTAGIIRVTAESGVAWFEHNAPIMRKYVEPDDPEFQEVFGTSAKFAEQTEPIEVAPRAWHDIVSFPPNLRFRRTFIGDQNQVQMRISDDDGRLIGVLFLYRGMVPETLLNRLGRGDPELFERMDRVSEPGRRAVAIMFADLEASGVLSRRLSSRGYFDLIRGLTDLIDSSVIAHDGIIGKHAGDGGSALFLAADFDDLESAAARAAIEAARAVRDGAGDLGADDFEVKLNIGLHWGPRLMVGQITTSGRLEVTALGDQMNECARIEAAAKDGAILASKDLLERLEPNDAQVTNLDPDAITYTLLGELDGVGEKAIRDAGAIPLAAI